ncbi:MAG: HIT family protein [Amphiplicatus sp.]|nr:HIT family protein [Amphiplicatus sp.]
MAPFELDPQLAEDTNPICDLSLCAVRLMKDARFPWIILIPKRPGAIEVHDLSAEERTVLIEEIAKTAAALKEVTGADKINIGALGNIVRQLHVHVAARFEGDATWPGPIWGNGPARPYPPGGADALSKKLRDALNA